MFETLILNVNMANIKQLFGPENLSGLSGNGSPGRCCSYCIGQLFVPILGLQPCDKAAMLVVNTIEFFLEEFT